MPRHYNTKSIRILLRECFSDQELREFCYDTPNFRDVYDQLTLHTGKAEIISLLIIHAENRGKFEEFLSLIAAQNPSQYQKYQPYWYELTSNPATYRNIFQFVPRPILMTLLIVGIVAVSGIFFFFTLRQPKIKPADSGEILVLVAEFDNVGDLHIKAGQRIYQELDKKIRQAGLGQVRTELIPQINQLKEAEAAGQLYGAAFVIWGWTDDVGIVPNFSITNPATDPVDSSNLQRPLLEPEEFKLYVANELPNHMAFLATFTIGQIYFREQNYQEARRLFQLASQSSAKDLPAEALANVYFYQGFAAHNLNLIKEALSQYNHAIALAPSLYQAYYNRGVINLDQKVFEQAILDFSTALKINPDLINAYINRGDAYRASQQWDKALADFDEVLHLDPNTVIARLNRGVVYQQTGRFEQALAEYNLAIEVTPDFPISYLNRAEIYAQLGSYDQSIADYQKALELDRHGQYYSKLDVELSLAWAYYQSGDYQTAIDMYQAILAANSAMKPDDPQSISLLYAHYNLALAFLANGQTDLATAEYNTALRLTHSPDIINEVMIDLENLLVKQPGTPEVIQTIEKLKEYKPLPVN